MNERIKELAEQAGLTWSKPYDFWCAYDEELERFAELIRQDECEACAKLCEAEMNCAYQEEAKLLPRGNNDLLRIAQGASHCVHAIRARGKE